MQGCVHLKHDVRRDRNLVPEQLPQVDFLNRTLAAQLAEPRIWVSHGAATLDTVELLERIVFVEGRRDGGCDGMLLGHGLFLLTQRARVRTSCDARSGRVTGVFRVRGEGVAIPRSRRVMRSTSLLWEASSWASRGLNSRSRAKLGMAATKNTVAPTIVLARRIGSIGGARRSGSP